MRLRSLIPFAVTALAAFVTAAVITAGLAAYALVVLVAAGVLVFGVLWEFGRPATGDTPEQSEGADPSGSVGSRGEG